MFRSMRVLFRPASTAVYYHMRAGVVALSLSFGSAVSFSGICSRPLQHVQQHAMSCAPVMVTHDDDEIMDDNESNKDRTFSDESMQALSNRLNVMIGLPASSSSTPPSEAAAGRGFSARSSRPATTAIPFIDENFPVRNPRDEMREAITAMAEAMQEALEAKRRAEQDEDGAPKVALSIRDETDSYTVVCKASGVDVFELLEVALEDGILLLALSAGLGAQSEQILVPVPLPPDAAGTVAETVHDEFTLEVRIDKVRDGGGDPAAVVAKKEPTAADAEATRDVAPDVSGAMATRDAALDAMATRDAAPDAEATRDAAPDA